MPVGDDGVEPVVAAFEQHEEQLAAAGRAGSAPAAPSRSHSGLVV